MTPTSAPKIRDYLLGNLSAEEEASLEELYFDDPERVAEVWAVFADLSEQYLVGELPATARSRFESRLRKSPALRRMFENEKALFRYAPTAQSPIASTAQPSPVPPRQPMPARSQGRGWWNWLALNHPFPVAALGAVIIAGAGLWLVWQARRTPPATTPPDPDQIAAAPTPAPPSPAPSPQAETSRKATVATFFLPVQSLRAGGETPVLSISKQTRIVRLELALQTSDYALYSAVLQSASNDILRTWDALSPRRGQPSDLIVLRLPATLLSDSSYVVKLRPLAVAGSEAFTQQYRFAVERS